MAERAFPFTTTNSGGNNDPYTESQTAQMFASIFLGNQDYGILRGYLNELLVSVTGGNVSVATGAAFIKGYWYVNDTAKTITVPAGSTPPSTGFRVVLRLDLTNDTITAELKISADGLSTPPAETQNSTIWEETLATGVKTTGGVVTLTDVRQFALFSTNHARLTGDTFAGNVTITNTTPGLIFIESDAAADNKRWQMILTAESFRLQVASDAGAAASFMTVERTANTIDSIALASTALTHNGNTFWNSANLRLRRQGGDANDWNIAGTTNYTPAQNYVRQVGVYNVAGPISNGATNTSVITFPLAFTDKPIVLLTVVGINKIYAYVDSVTETGFSIVVFNNTGGSAADITVNWSAEGV